MSLKKFIAPQLVIIIALFTLRLSGLDAVVKSNNDDETNIIKYAQATRSIMANYFS